MTRFGEKGQLKKLAIIAVVIALATSAVVLYIYTRGAPSEVERFDEVDELFIYVDEQGNASCQYVAQVPPSVLADKLRLIVQAFGKDSLAQSYVESIRDAMAKYGIEVKNSSCEVTGLNKEDNFKLIITWTSPAIARRKDNHWTITMAWVDNSTAQDVLASQESTWATIRGIAENSTFNILSKAIVVLPAGAENVNCPSLNHAWTIDFGGGSNLEASLRLEQIDGKPAVVETDQTLLVTKNEITVTAQQLLENYPMYTIDYDGAFTTDNLSFADSIARARLDLKYGLGLDDQYSTFIGLSEYSLSPAQLLYYTADAVVTINQGGQYSIQQLQSVAAPTVENGDWTTYWGKISKSEYISLAQHLRDEIASGNAPGMINTSLGKIRFRDALFTFVRILSIYGENGVLPSEIMLVPVPTGKLAWDNAETPANYAYFLLPDTYVIIDSALDNQVLAGVYQPGYDNRELALNLCNWANSNITYTYMYPQPTSEWVLDNKRGQCRDYANAYLALTRTAGIPAKRVGGWIVSAWQPPAGWEFTVGTTPDGKPIAPHAWTQVYLQGRGWTFVDPTAGAFENVPHQIYKQMEQTWVGALAGYETAYGTI